VATTDLVGAAMARVIPEDTPLWVDLYGDPLAEGQLIAAQHCHDGGLAPLVANMVAILSRADHLSTCSRAHRLAMLGQLGMVGRLGAASCHGELVSVLPGMLVSLPEPQEGAPLRGSILPADATIVLWSGGFNTWTDIGTLQAGLETAMGETPNLHFVCLGGAIDKHNPGTHAEFEQRVAASPHRDRFHLLGWRPQAEVARLMREADMGLNIDAVCHEAELGTRTRLLEWAEAGLAICSTPTSEMTRDLAEADALAPFEVGDSEGLAKALMALGREEGHRHALGERAREFVRSHWTPETAGDELAHWVRSPRRAPDRVTAALAAGTNRLIAWMRALEPALRSNEEPTADLAAVCHRLQSLEGSALVRLRDLLRGRG
jgi:glycosyltransferase involved in cell wall biosynthesis